MDGVKSDVGVKESEEEGVQVSVWVVLSDQTSCITQASHLAPPAPYFYTNKMWNFIR